VQDESAYLVTELLQIQKGDMVLDACSAPGGKYTAFLEKDLEDFLLIGTDIYYDRISVVKKNCIRLGLTSYLLLQSDTINSPFQKKFDKILIDAPCSGLGTIQKNPDIKWRRTEKEIENFQKLQINILNALKFYVKPGGIIVYSTCTINREENEEVIECFLQTNKNFSIISPYTEYKKFLSEGKYIRSFPHIHKMDGSFAAILQCLE
jgi:16S rRNA (cytosine967-C5)-methyltransferase